MRRTDARPIKAEFFLTSGRRVKTASFEAPTIIAGQPIISRIVIVDELKSRSRTVMTFDSFTPKPIDDKIFNPSRSES